MPALSKAKSALDLQKIDPAASAHGDAAHLQSSKSYVVAAGEDESYVFSSGSSSDYGRGEGTKDDYVSSICEESSQDTVSENSDRFPPHYYTGHRANRRGKIVKYETEEERQEKHQRRMKDFHRLLGKYHVCVLPNVNQYFEDCMPMFHIFTTDCSRTNVYKKKKLN